MRIAVTGAWGNLGWKLIQYLVTNTRPVEIFGLDVRLPSDQQRHVLASLGTSSGTLRVIPICCDVSDFGDERWRNVIDKVDAIIHFAAQNPFPDATWHEALASLDMTIHLAEAAGSSGSIKRFVFASSNHVMGRYKDDPLSDTIEPGGLHTALEPAPGTRWNANGRIIDATPYATSKLIGEQVCRFQARKSGGQTTFACIRIGWCQPGQNLPETISITGIPTLEPDCKSLDPDQRRNRQWFERMWFSNRDFLQLFSSALFTDGQTWPEGFILVNGMSANADMVWDLTGAQKWLDYQPKDGYSG